MRRFGTSDGRRGRSAGEVDGSNRQVDDQIGGRSGKTVTPNPRWKGSPDSEPPPGPPPTPGDVTPTPSTQTQRVVDAQGVPVTNPPDRRHPFAYDK